MLQRQIASVLLLAALFAVTVLVVGRPQDAKPATFQQSPSSWIAAQELAFFNGQIAAAGDTGRIRRAWCVPHAFEHLYLCSFAGVNNAGKPQCLQIAVHFKSRAAFDPTKDSGLAAWHCGAKPPPFQPFPGDPASSIPLPRHRASSSGSGPPA